jgi:hypothetical protein
MRQELRENALGRIEGVWEREDIAAREARERERFFHGRRGRTARGLELLESARDGRCNPIG